MQTVLKLIKWAANLVQVSINTTLYLVHLPSCFAQGTAFTYQDRLIDQAEKGKGFFPATGASAKSADKTSPVE